MEGGLGMLNKLALSCSSGSAVLATAIRPLVERYPWLAIVVDPEPAAAARRDHVVTIAAARWMAADFDPLPLDDEIFATIARCGGVSLTVHAPEPDTCVVVAAEVVTRYQRHLGGRNQASSDPLFDRALGLHRDLHDRTKPLVAADYDHTLDTWRWVLRLDPRASLATQLAALFHDVERLTSESEVRVEHQRPHYAAFKAAHAAAGARIVTGVMQQLGAPPELRRRVAELVHDHERPHDDPDKLLVNEADALSFFSLNACGFLAYYGLEHTRRKVAYTLARLGPRGRRELATVRHRRDIARLIEACAAPGADANAGAAVACEVQP